MSDDLIREGINLGQLARHQRFLLWCILASMVVNFAMPFWLPQLDAEFGPVMSILYLLFVVVVNILIIIVVMRLMSALNRNIVIRVICAVLMFIPLLSLFVLLSVNNQTNKAFKRAGIRVGLMGVADETVRRRLLDNLCRECGYDLTGNVSGVCPECGTTIRFVDSQAV